MDNQTDQLAHYLAQNLVELRKKRGLGQLELSSHAGIPRSTIANLETGSGNPTLTNLAKLGQALGVSIEELITRPSGRGQLTRAQDLSQKIRSQGEVLITKLLPVPLKGLEFDKVEINPGATLKGTPHLAGTLEWFTVVKGEAKVWLEGEEYHLLAGDVLSFAGDQKHSYSAAGNGKMSGISVVALAQSR